MRRVASVLATLHLLFGSCAGVEVEQLEPGGELTLMTKARAASVQLPILWESSMAFEPNGEEMVTVGNRTTLPCQKVADDVWCMGEAEFDRVLDSLGRRGAGHAVSLPQDLGLLIRWSPGSGVVERVNAAHLRGMKPLDFAVHQRIPHGVEQPGQARSMENRWVSTWSFLCELPPAVAGSDLRIPRRAEPMGLGFLEMRARDGATFAAGGNRTDGPSPTREAWFYAAVDQDGAIWMWFEED